MSNVSSSKLSWFGSLNTSATPLLLLNLCFWTAAASFVWQQKHHNKRHRNQPFASISDTHEGKKATDMRKANFRQVLQQVGKSVFRPGGTQATTTLLRDWAQLNDKHSVLELSSGVVGRSSRSMARTGQNLVRQYGCQVTLADPDESLLKEALDLCYEKTADKISSQVLDMLHLDKGLTSDQHFDATILETSLTHCTDANKLKILKDLRTVSGSILFHELCLNDDNGNDKEALEKTKQDMTKALVIRFAPLTQKGWVDLVEEAGYEVSHVQVQPLNFLTPQGLVQDEGITGAGRIAWNLATHPDLRERMSTIKAAIKSHSHVLRYIILRATKKEDQT